MICIKIKYKHVKSILYKYIYLYRLLLPYLNMCSIRNKTHYMDFTENVKIILCKTNLFIFFS